MYFHQDIMELAKKNNNFRQEIVTAKYSQVVLMSVPPGDDIGLEKHSVDQILIFVEGEGEGFLNGERFPVKPYHLVVVPAATNHNFTNTGAHPLKLITIYAPAEHKPGTIRRTKEEAERNPE